MYAEKITKDNKTKTLIIHAAIEFNDLKIPPGNKLHKLQGDMQGYCAIWINDQYRLCFQFKRNDCYAIHTIDYHGWRWTLWTQHYLLRLVKFFSKNSLPLWEWVKISWQKVLTYHLLASIQLLMVIERLLQKLLWGYLCTLEVQHNFGWTYKVTTIWNKLKLLDLKR